MNGSSGGTSFYVIDLIVPIDAGRGRRCNDLVMCWLLHADNGYRNIDK